jgi:hypothetical protein
VNASQFLELIQHADFLEKNEVLQLKKVQSNFPYFQVSHVLAARYEFLKNGDSHIPSLGQAAVTSLDRIWLKNFIEKSVSDQAGNSKKPVGEDLLPESKSKEPSMAEQTEKLKKLDEGLKGISQETEEKIAVPEAKIRVRRKSPPDDLIETIKRKAKKEILDEKKKEQIDLIKAFSKKSIKLATIKEIEANQNTENLAAESTKISDKLISESFAKMLASQGKYKMAKEIYQKLILKFPDKRAYFADSIEKLKD